MRYDPIKDKLGKFVRGSVTRQKLFFAALNAVFLRTWYIRRELDRILEDQRTEEEFRVLDAGTGFGQYAYWMARRYTNVRVRAVDVKADYIEDARRFLEQTPQKEQVLFAVDDLTRLTSGRPYDLILSVDVMEHIEDDQAVFSNFARVLAPGGVVVVNTPSDLGGSDVTEATDESFISEHVRDGYNMLELEAKLRREGLHPIRSIYTYGKWGSIAWRLLIKYPMKMLSKSMAFLMLLPFYYIPVFPVGMLLNWMDVRSENKSGSGLLIVARK